MVESFHPTSIFLLFMCNAGDPAVLADAWLNARGEDIAAIIEKSQENESDSAFVDGCIDLDSLAAGLPTAVELGLVLEDAIGQILEAVQCGTNLEPGEEECTWANRKFIGSCISGDTVDTRSSCLQKFIDCREEKPMFTCFEERKLCVKAGYPKDG